MLTIWFGLSGTHSCMRLFEVFEIIHNSQQNELKKNRCTII